MPLHGSHIYCRLSFLKLQSFRQLRDEGYFLKRLSLSQGEVMQDSQDVKLVLLKTLDAFAGGKHS